MVTATDYYTKAPRRSWSSTPAHIYQVLLHIIFFVLLRTYHVASAAHIKLLTLNSLGRKKTNTLRKAARAPLPPPGHLLRQLLAWYNGNCALNTIFQFWMIMQDCLWHEAPKGEWARDIARKVGTRTYTGTPETCKHTQQQTGYKTVLQYGQQQQCQQTRTQNANKRGVCTETGHASSSADATILQNCTRYNRYSTTTVQTVPHILYTATRSINPALRHLVLFLVWAAVENVHLVSWYSRDR